MTNGVHTIVEFGDNDKWFVIAEKMINGNKYSYLIRVNDTEDDFIDEFRVVKSYFKGKDEYMNVVNGNELKQIMPILVPEVKKLMGKSDELKKILNLDIKN